MVMSNSKRARFVAVDGLVPIRPDVARLRRVPRGMDKVKIGWESKQAMTKVALSIFTDVTNLGYSFQDAVLAIYLSGLQHGAALSNGGEEN